MADRIVVFGDLFDDIVAVPAGPIRPDTDTESSILLRAGGSAANAAAWMGSFGAQVDFVAMVGADDAPRHTATLEHSGVTPHLLTHPALPTGSIVVIVQGDQRTMLTDKGANAVLTADDVGDELLDAASIVHFTGYSLFGLGREAAVSRLFERAGERGVLVSVDPGSAGFIADFGAERFLAAVDGASLFFPNLDEGRLLTGLTEPAAVVSRLAERIPLVALTLGTAGAIVAEPGGMLAADAVPAVVVDPTGAGDAFAAGFIAEWIGSRDVASALPAAVRAGARAVEVSGGRPPA